MAELQITCLGDFQVALDGTALTTFQTDKSRALLAYLTIEGWVHQRTELAQFLWPGYSEESARNSLRQGLHQLRQTLAVAEAAPGGAPPDTPWLLLTRQTVQINPDAPIGVDVLTFRHLLATCASHAHAALTTCAPCLARLRQAVDLYRGDFLAGFTVADSDPFEEWRRIIQEQLHIQMLDALTQLAAAAEAAGDEAQALQDAHRLLTLEPWLEEAHRQIMRLLAQRGQRAGALAQYQRCRQVLAEELAAEPDGETTALYAQIRTGEFDKGTRRQGDKGTSDKGTNKLPVTLSPTHLVTPLFGRSTELAHLTALLAQPTTRLVTLVGPPGVGKTRLAQAASAEFGDQGSLHFFVELAAITDPTLVAITLVQALGRRVSGGQTVLAGLIEELRDQALLLVLDNFEQVLAAGPTVLHPLLAQCPQLKLLVTSRVALHLQGEQVVPVEPLPLPDLTQPATVQSLRDNPAVQFFCQQAARVQPTFQLTAALAPVVAAICNQLEGLPLALELAAARTRVLPPPTLLARLTNAFQARLHLLTGGSHDLPPRQQTLRAALAWSYDLLDATEQSIFRQLAVFVGGCTLEAAEAVIGDWGLGISCQPIPNPQSPISILNSIESLLDKSLLRQQSTASGEPRFGLLETIREYAWELLAGQEVAAHDALLATQQRHAAFFLALVEEAASKLAGATQVAWLDRLETEHDNLRAALGWLEQNGEVRTALRLATQLRYFWRVRGYAREGTERLLRLLAHPAAAPADAGRAQALNTTGYLQWVQGNVAAAQSLLAEALPIGRTSNEPAVAAFALRYLGAIADVQQDQATAHAHFQESLDLYRSLDNPNETALALMYLGDAALAQRDDTRAQQLYQESAALFRQLGNNIVLPYALRHLGYLALWQGDYAAAAQYGNESLTLNLAVGERQGSAAALVALAALAAAQAQWPRAARLLAVAEGWLTASHSQLLPFDRDRYTETKTTLPTHLPAPALATEQAAAQAMTTEEALTYALQVFAPDKVTGRQGDWVTELVEVTQSPSPLVSPSPPHNLPGVLAPLIGRAQALAEIASRLQARETRLLTLVGPGGIGKTGLALAVGREHLPVFADGVFFVALAAINQPSALAPAIASALGWSLQGGDPRSALLQTLRARQLLLILDNFEHLLVEGPTAIDLVVDLLASAPEMQIIVTSRERLKLRGEQLYAVQPLTFAATATLAEATALPAVRLFVQAVQRVQADFRLTATNLAAVLRICRLVQGMPLGLELAAANAGGVPLTAIADAIEQSAEFLTVDWRDLPERQRSMRAVFAWSWQLLTDEERRILRQSAVFRGGFAYTAAQTVTGATLPLLTRLTDKSLLQWQGAATGEGRYALHELLRQFAAEELNASGEQALVEERHGCYYLAYLAARGRRLGRGEPKEASSEIQAKLDNVRLAWQWAVSQGRLAEIEQATYAWWQFCQFQGLEFEGRQSFAVAVEGVRRQLVRVPTGRGADEAAVLLGQRLLAKLLAIHANYLFAQGCDEEMAAQAREAVALGAASGGFEGETFGTFVLGRALQDLEQKREAGELWRQTIQLVRRYQPNHPENELLHEAHWMAHNWLRGSALHSGDYTGSRAYMVQALQICQTLGKRWGELYCLAALAGIDFFLYDFAAAEAGFAAALALARTLSYRRVEMVAQDGLAGVLRLRGDYTRARTLLEQAVSMAAELAFPYDEALFLAALIRLHCQLGDQAAAAQRHEQLTQLLARVNLAKECQLYSYLAAAIKAHYGGARQEALRYAEQADQVNQQGGDILFRLVDTALILGHVRAAVGQWEPATAAFQQALDAFQQFAGARGARALAAEPQAGLAHIALAQGDLASAQAQVEAILPVLVEQPHAGYNDPFFIYLTCYRVLAAPRGGNPLGAADPRAATLLQQGYDLLQQDAADLEDENRHRFLEAVPSHRTLVAAYRAWRTQEERETRRQGFDVSDSTAVRQAFD